MGQSSSSGLANIYLVIYENMVKFNSIEIYHYIEDILLIKLNDVTINVDFNFYPNSQFLPISLHVNFLDVLLIIHNDNLTKKLL